MSQILQMYYYGNRIAPIPRITYKTEVLYQNDTVVGILYRITLNGKIIGSDFGDNLGGPPGTAEGMRYLNDIFSTNGHLLEIDEILPGGGMVPIFLANDILVRNISLNPSADNWGKSVDYTVELESMNVYVGSDLTNLFNHIANGGLDGDMNFNMSSPNMVNPEFYSIKDWNEQFNIQTGDTQISTVNFFEREFNYEMDIEDIINAPIQYKGTLGGEYFTISYNVTATGKQKMNKEADGLDDPPRVLPAWEHAKRFVHTKLLYQMGGLFDNFLSQNGSVFRQNLGAYTGQGVFSNFIRDPNNDITYSSYSLYNEHFSFDASESAGTFSVTYNATIKRDCPGYAESNELNDPYTAYTCLDNALHTVTKSVSKTYEANEYDTYAMFPQTSISVNGTITGLVPGGIMAPESRLKINTLPTGSFLCYNTNIYHPQLNIPGGVDKSYYANLAFDKIFNYNTYDLSSTFKDMIGITPFALGVSPSSRLLPSSMNVTRDLIAGTVNYSATYDNKYNCDINNFDIKISTNESIPVISEFVIPNNNTKDPVGVYCDKGRGYGAIQLLGTFTPKTLDVSITASVAADFNKCCLGTSDNWNIFDYDFATMENFVLPSGMIIPYISEDYALTKKTKSVTYPEGSMNFSLSYVCADICEIKGYFTDSPNGN